MAVRSLYSFGCSFRHRWVSAVRLSRSFLYEHPVFLSRFPQYFREPFSLPVVMGFLHRRQFILFGNPAQSARQTRYAHRAGTAKQTAPHQDVDISPETHSDSLVAPLSSQSTHSSYSDTNEPLIQNQHTQYSKERSAYTPASPLSSPPQLPLSSPQAAAPSLQRPYPQ